MLGRARTNLNQISFDSAIGMVQRAIAAGVTGVEVYVDTVGDPKQYTERRAAAAAAAAPARCHAVVLRQTTTSLAWRLPRHHDGNAG